MRACTFLIGGVFLATIGASSALANSGYTCATFQYGSAAYTDVTGTNNQGEVIGTWANVGQPSHAFLRNANGMMARLSSPAGSDEFTPVGINNLGQIAGPSFILNLDGSYTDVPPAVAPPGHTYQSTQITGINDKGELSGTIIADSNSDGGTILVFTRGTDGQYRILDQSLFGAPYPSLISGPINNSDVLVEHTRYTDGYLVQPNGSKVPLLYPGVPFDSGSPGGSTYTGGLNNKNVTTGSTHSDVTNNVAFIRTVDGHYPDVVCSEAGNAALTVRGINDQNVVVGSFFGRALSGGLVELGFIAAPTGVFPQANISRRNWTFASHLVGETSGLGTAFVSNSGAADLHVGALYIGNTGQPTDKVSSFYITNSNCAPVPDGPPSLPVIPPGGSCFVDFRFAPKTSRWQTAALYIPTDSPDSPLVIELGGTGIGSPLQLSSTSWHFAAHRVYETSGNGVIYVHNPGPAPVAFGSIQLNGTGGFNFNLLSSDCNSSLAPYKTCSLIFNFTPTSSGEHTASLDLNDNSASGPIHIPVDGYAY